MRAYDGHVSLQNRLTKAWTDVKCDLQVPGLLLLRDGGGKVSVGGHAQLQQGVEHTAAASRAQQQRHQHQRQEQLRGARGMHQAHTAPHPNAFAVAACVGCGLFVLHHVLHPTGVLPGVWGAQAGGPV